MRLPAKTGSYASFDSGRPSSDPLLQIHPSGDLRRRRSYPELPCPWEQEALRGAEVLEVVAGQVVAEYLMEEAEEEQGYFQRGDVRLRSSGA